MNRPNILDKEYQDFNKLGMSSPEIDSVIYSSYCKELEEYCDYLEEVIGLAAWKLAQYDKNDIQYWKEWLYKKVGFLRNE